MLASRVKSLEVSAPAKLNLFLDVLRRRPDGYHELLTLFERISLKDTLRLRKIAGPAIVITSVGEEVPLDSGNIAYQAADLIRKAHRIASGVKIAITKRIPVGAGLAGGSSDAAAVLLGMNALFDLRLDTKAMMRYAHKLGSDVAFFIFNRPFALGKGRGEELKSVLLPQKVTFWHLLFAPYLKVMTKDVYALWDKEEKSLKLTKKEQDVNILLSHLRRKDAVLLNRNIYNQLSETVMKSYRLVSDLRSDLLGAGLKFVHMSGSGPTFFTVFKTQKEALKAQEALGRRFQDRCRIFLASTV
jgi:4-diphosphocytidyl-2-C-methyl-D-erythritol kinase